MKEKVMATLKNFGVPRLIITGFLLLLLIMAPFVGADLPTQRTAFWSWPWSPWYTPDAV